MTDREQIIFNDVFNPDESDLDYFIRRGLEMGTLTKEEAEKLKNEILDKKIDKL